MPEDIKKYTSELKDVVMSLDSARRGTANERPVDISLSEVITEKYGLSQADFLDKLGVDTRVSTMENLLTMPTQGVNWLVPEIIRDAITLGMRSAPFYPNLIASEQSIAGLTAIMPMVNMSEAAPSKINEAEAFPMGNVSFGSKSITLFKIGKGLALTDEIKNYVSMDVLSIFLRDFGIQLGYSMDTLALDVLINGNAADGSESASVIGVKDTSKGIQYRDMLKIWVRASRMGRNFNNLIGGEDQALDILDLPEFKNRNQGTTQATLNVKSPVPTSADFYIHPGTPANQLLMLDKSSAMIKLTAQALSMETERIASNQTSAIYASCTTGFSKLYNDAVLMLDSSKDFKTSGFPTFMNIDPYLGINLI